MTTEQKECLIRMLNFQNGNSPKLFEYINKLSDTHEENQHLNFVYLEILSNNKTIDDLTHVEKCAIFQMFNGRIINLPIDIRIALYEHKYDFNGQITGFHTNDENYSFELLYEKGMRLTMPELKKLVTEIHKCWGTEEGAEEKITHDDMPTSSLN